MFFRRTALLLVLGLAGLAALAVVAAAEPSFPTPRGEAQILGTFVMRGEITTAVRVRGEHRGERITRHWTFLGQQCGRRYCRRLVMARGRGDHRLSRLRLRRGHDGVYRGAGEFFAPVRCRGRTYRRGVRVPYVITVRVTRAVSVDGVPFASRLRATYLNRVRIDRTRCPLGPSHDAARYVGRPAKRIVASATDSSPASFSGRLRTGARTA